MRQRPFRSALFVVIPTCCLLVLLVSGTAHGGWFGPSESDVVIKQEGGVGACKVPHLPYPCCWRLCFRITNNAKKRLTSTTFTVTGRIAGRSTDNEFCGRLDPCKSDAIIPPHESRVECYEGIFHNSEPVCEALTITSTATYAKFE